MEGLGEIKVIETSSGIAGPVAGRLLADWGADVIHIEHPVTGDMGRDTRRLLTSYRTHLLAGRNIPSDINYSVENNNCNKRGMTLNLSKESGQKIIHTMLETADVLLSNFRPRELKKFNLEYQTLSQLNPKLIHANITGYGSKGPDQDLPGYDFNAFWARSGILRVLLTPEMDPFTTPVGLGDRVTALALACGIMTALFIRERSGIGQEVDTSIFNTGIFVNSHDVGAALVTGQDRQNANRQDLANVLLGSYKTRDGRWLRIAINQPDRYWSRVCQAIGRNDLENDPRFASFNSRIENHNALFTILEEMFLTRTLDEWKVILTEAGLPWAPVASLPEVVSDPQARANDFFTSYDHPTYGHMEIVANPIKLNKTSVVVNRPAPEFGQHTEEILQEYGYSWEDIAQFKEQGVIA
jgi:crotonobetainyl-CoA:carnitine CoA-transferase CaiB-like acyl-CoA transferase